MYNKFFTWLSLCSVFAAFAFSAAAQTPAPTAPSAGGSRLGDIRASRVVGTVTFTDIATGAVQPLANDQVIHQGTIVKTEADSSVVLLFSNGAAINLAHTSELNIEQFTQDPFAAPFQPATATEEPSVSVTSIKLNRGELVGNVKKLRTSAGSKFTVGTPVGAAGIRGTTFRIVYRPTGNGLAFNFSLMTIEGDVAMELATGTVNAPISVTDNQEVVINDVTVNPTTNEITVTTSTGQQVTVPAPTVTTANSTDIQVVMSAFQTIVDEVAAKVFSSPTQSTGNSSNTSNNNSSDTTNNQQNSQNNTNNEGNNSNRQSENLSNSSGSTSSSNRITNPPVP